MSKPYYADDLVTIYHLDFRDVAASVAPSVTIADPPYGQTSLEWDRWPAGWPEDIPGASMWVFGTLRMFMDHEADFATTLAFVPAWKLSQDIVWEKHNGSSLAADRFSRVHESIAHFYRGQWQDIFRKVQTTPDATARTVRRKALPPQHQGARGPSAYASVDGGPRLQRSVIQVRSTHGYAENETQKPLGIIAPLIGYSCAPGGLVFDPFMGSGSVLVAAKASGFRAVGCDVRESQCEIAARRCSQEVLGLGA